MLSIVSTIIPIRSGPSRNIPRMTGPRTWKKAFLSPSASYPGRSRARPPYWPARERMDAMLPRMMEAAGVTEELKARDPMRWVGLMNTLKAQIEENIAIKLLYS